MKKVSEDEEFKKIMADLDQPVMYLNGADFAKFLQEAPRRLRQAYQGIEHYDPVGLLKYRLNQVIWGGVLPADQLTAADKTRKDVYPLHLH